MYQHRQIHVWISESDYLMLREQADVSRDSVSAVIRRLIKNERTRVRPMVVRDDEPLLPPEETGSETVESYAT